MNRHINEQTELEQLLRASPQLRDAGFSRSVLQQVESYRLHKRMILGSVWVLTILSALLIAPWQYLISIITRVEWQISEYAARLTPANSEYTQAINLPALLQNHGVLVASLAMLLIVLFTMMMAQD